jgi:hypothetical protein
MTDHIHRIHHVVEATTLRWTFEGGMREAAQKALALLQHEAKKQMKHSQYRHFSSSAWEGVEGMVKLTHALVWDLDEAIKEVKLLWEHKKESSQKITELEALCKRLKEDAQKLKEEKTTLEGMIQSHDELIMEMAEEYGLNWMGENDDEDDNDEGNAAAPRTPMPPASTPEEIIEDAGLCRWSLSKKPSAAWRHLGKCWAWDAATSSLPHTQEGLWGEPAQDDGWLGWSRWWPKWRPLWHGWVVSWRWE